MSDRIPGSCWDNPIWHGKWRIFLSGEDDPQLEYACVHDDYDGAPDAGDSRCYYAPTVELCKKYADEHDND